MTIEEMLGNIWSLIETWGPVALLVFAVFALIVLTLVIFVFVKVFRGMADIERSWKEKNRRFKL